MAVMGPEELLRECDGRLAKGLKRGRGPGHDARVLPELLNLFEEGKVHLLCLEQRRLELLVPLLEALNLQTLPLARRLGGAAVAEDALDPALFLLVFGLGTFPG